MNLNLLKNNVKQGIVTLLISFAVIPAVMADDSSLQLTPLPANQGALNPPATLDPQQVFPKSSPVDQAVFNSVTKQAMPMSPEQIQRLKQMLTVTQQAAAASATTPPVPVNSSIMVSLAPGATPPAVRLQQGFISSLVFVDSSGNSWPIEGYDIGNPNAFSIQWQQKSNTLLVQASTMFTYGNLAVKLQGLATPVMLTLIPGQQQVDYRVDLHVLGQSPTAPLQPTGQGTPDQASNVLLNVLNNIPPDNAKELQITGGSCDASIDNCRGWVAQGKMYLRIPMDILSPGWIQKMQSSDGTRAYELMKSSSVLASSFGNTVQLKIEGF